MESIISLLAVGEPWYSGILADLNGFCVYIIGLIYKAAAYFLRIFLVLANGKLVDSDNYETLINNFYLIIGIGMLFVLAFALLRNMINPEDKKGTSTVKKVVLNLVTSAMIVALLPTIFAFAFDFQNSILIRQNTIGRFFGYGGGNGIDGAIDQGANQLANGVFTAFFNADQGFCEDLTLQECQAQIETDDGEASLDEVINEVNVSGKFGMYADFKDSIGSAIEHNIILNLIAGLLLIYVSVSFCFDMAVRYIKLIFYQIIAPIPVFCRVIPEGKLSSIFNQWVKVTLTCYLEVFIRILIFYFCIYLYNSLFGSNGYGASWDFLSGTSYNVMFFVKAFIIMGIVMFMKQAPKLISEITGIDSGNMKLGIRDKLKDGGFFAATNAAGGLITGGIPGAVRGLRYGNNNEDFRNIGAEITRRRNNRALREEARRNGASRLGIMGNRLRNAIGMESTYDEEMRRIDEQIKALDEQIENARLPITEERIEERQRGNNVYKDIHDRIENRAKDRINREDSDMLGSLLITDAAGNPIIDQSGNLNSLKTWIDNHANSLDAATLHELRQQWYAEQERLTGVYVDQVATGPGVRDDAVMRDLIANARQGEMLNNVLMDENGVSTLTVAQRNDIQNRTIGLWDTIHHVNGDVNNANGALGRRTTEVNSAASNLENQKLQLQHSKNSTGNIARRYEATMANRNNGNNNNGH